MFSNFNSGYIELNELTKKTQKLKILYCRKYIS